MIAAGTEDEAQLLLYEAVSQWMRRDECHSMQSSATTVDFTQTRSRNQWRNVHDSTRVYVCCCSVCCCFV